MVIDELKNDGKEIPSSDEQHALQTRPVYGFYRAQSNLPSSFNELGV
jgi:hypothetical protein